MQTPLNTYANTYANGTFKGVCVLTLFTRCYKNGPPLWYCQIY